MAVATTEAARCGDVDAAAEVVLDLVAILIVSFSILRGSASIWVGVSVAMGTLLFFRLLGEMYITRIIDLMILLSLWDIFWGILENI